MSNITTIIFDLDGTLTNTLTDIAASTNYALTQMGWPERTIDEVRRFVGNGVRRLIEQAVPQQAATAADVDRCLALFREHYVKNCQCSTCLYDGIDDLLHQLRRLGYRLAIVSNKMQSGVDELYKAFFSDVIELAVGERPGIARKPDAAMLEFTMAEMGVSKDECVYVGDSEVDLLTAQNTGIPCISVLWGFRDKGILSAHGATTFAEHPSDILKLIKAPSNSPKGEGCKDVKM